MTKASRVLIILAAALLGLTFVFPLWEISIYAPQYPEGLSMQIWTTQITGDVQNVNILNHYIGMRAIHAADFKELIWFSKIFTGLLVTGILVGILAKRILGYLWSLSLIGFCSWAFFDFWKWEYDFGHQLNPDAPIQVEGMSYAPPLIGSKELLNITASSWPSGAGLAVIFAVIFSIAVIVIESQKKNKLKTLSLASLTLILGISSSACFTSQPEPIFFGKDHCQSCQMTLVDRRFGVEWVNDKGKAFKFDSLECYLNFTKKQPEITSKGTAYVVEQGTDGKLIPVDQASFVLSHEVRSPMGIGYFATKNTENKANIKSLNWQELLATLQDPQK